MAPNLVCSVISPVVTFYQSFLDLMFGLVSFLGVPAPGVKSTVSALLGCTL